VPNDGDVRFIKAVALIKQNEFQLALQALDEKHTFERAYCHYRCNDLKQCCTLLDSVKDKSEEFFHLEAQVVGPSLIAFASFCFIH
jgi:hypothetical protein